jgi:hypothetical protein
VVILNPPNRRHPDALVGPALTTDTAVHVCGVGAVFEVVAAGCREGGLELVGPFVVGPGQSHTWLEVRPRSRSTLRNSWPP